jgi:adenosylcobinamide kinase/adenosylcobinamide-phosphate guanylyltransferase
MMVLVIGPNGSGKSAAAERVARRLRAEGAGVGLVYLATFVPADDDGRRRVARHRQQRADLGFTTVESPLGVLEGHTGAVVLLEDVSNLLANLTFSAHDPDPVAATLRQIESLQSSGSDLVAVTIGGLTAEPGFDGETVAYVAALDRVNAALRRLADQVIDTSRARADQVIDTSETFADQVSDRTQADA